MAMDNYSLSDIAAATDGGFGGGNNMLAWMFLFVILGGGFGGFGNRQAATTDELSAGFANSSVLNKLNELGAGQAGINQNLSNAICQSEYKSLEHYSALSAQIADCCCKTQQAVHAEGEATRAMLQQNKIDALQQQVNQLQTAQTVSAATANIPRVNMDGFGVYSYPACAPQTCGCGTAY